jgi:hypothetical protein
MLRCQLPLPRRQALTFRGSDAHRDVWRGASVGLDWGPRRARSRGINARIWTGQAICPGRYDRSIAGWLAFRADLASVEIEISSTELRNVVDNHLTERDIFPH